MSFILRAYRINKVFKYYTQSLDANKVELHERASGTSNNYESISLLKKLYNLREEVLIKKCILYIILPILIFGIAASFVPWLFVFLPVHSPNSCWLMF
jgi:hypothetical protein